MSCDRLAPDLRSICNQIESKTDSLNTKIYIVAGSLGGVGLILLIIVIILAVLLFQLKGQVARLRREGNSNATTQNPVTTQSAQPASPNDKNGFVGGNLGTGGQQHISTSFQHTPQSQTQLSNNKGLTSAEEELAQLGFSAYTGAQNESRVFSPGLSAGGVRVLPRNPPTGFRHTGQNENGFM